MAKSKKEKTPSERLPRTTLYLSDEDRARADRLRQHFDDGRGVPSLTQFFKLLLTREEARLGLDKEEGK
jgi:hypothetical protein